MKTFTAAALLIAAVSARSTPLRARQDDSTHTILPAQIALHDVINGGNSFTMSTVTARGNGKETSTLYQVEFEEALAGLTCVAHFFSGRATDSVAGTGDLDFFSTDIANLVDQTSGNLRDQPLGRIDFVNIGQEFSIDPTVPFAYSEGFPCPAGFSIVLESAAVGESDNVTVGQDFAGAWVPAMGTPNGLSFTAY